MGQKVSYSEAVKRVKVSSRLSESIGRPPVSRPEESEPERMSFSKVEFLAFIAMVINCTALEKKSQKIDVVVVAAEKYLCVRDFSEDLQEI